MNKISCVMTTYGRFTCVERSVNMFLDQVFDTLVDQELIIYNTDDRHPIALDDELLALGNIRVINNNIDLQTHQPYTNVGAIRRDAVVFATGQWYICWDDDDIFLPWNNQQCLDRVLHHRTMDLDHETMGWKPKYSLFTTPNKLELAQNTLEASIIVLIDCIRSQGFRLENGSEHLGWYTALSHTGRLVENDEYSIPGYSYNWSDPGDIAGHKQSGNMGDPNNFENHKNASQDHAKRPLRRWTPEERKALLGPYFEYFKAVINGTHNPAVPPTYPPNFHPKLIERYVQPHLS